MNDDTWFDRGYDDGVEDVWHLPDDADASYQYELGHKNGTEFRLMNYDNDFR